MRPVHPTADEGNVQIGAKLRTARNSQRLTLEQLATATGLTKGFISRIERDDTLPSVPTLVQLCQALSLPIGSLFEEPNIQRIALADAPHINMGGELVDERLVTPRSVDEVQVIRSSLKPHATGGDTLYTVNCTLEVLHVISGRLTLVLVGREEELLAGDTITFPGPTPHTWRTDSEGAEITWTLVPAAWSGSA
ncbi:helix-turn-helix domain-containing protein [Leucobacter viscericola]|uniref:Helix-turn-helix domain-containing protein n=1 Tax=Leucobacter viscericola TaxID=2714935 RepID=A0A6G7XHI8_9MICO|nr:XRE family transcriptional regulator [Leucobacter viscericola]QIK64070.1 helix-turn-helix domain-containing protein [Leucobacter viscericola]